MDTIHDLKTWQNIRRSKIASSVRVGFVPTMGALHAGHASLLERARRECDVVVLSIFVNPTQFDNPEDLAKYPLTLEADLALAARLGTDYVLLPDHAQMYPDDYAYQVIENRFSRELCGAHRPGHFNGVLTVVMKLLNLVRPHRAYFGEKDAQQLELVRAMVDVFFMDVEIIPCPTLRDHDGLALSSRNTRLAPDDRQKARLFPELLQSSLPAGTVRSQLEKAGFQVDYIVDRDGRRYGAVHIGGVRLIDNVIR
ncbi:MAG: pantoate--beta-alanine ligase [Bdellovibrionaceae bacterium]|nr:pantoate--beta-alanine ligase [Pseudobdellovibrionaceae bacterium]